jgi:molybdate transport system ATP-binding protein
MTKLFELANASLVYRALPALDSISWSVQSGEQWAVLGPNGAGKTSLARILTEQVRHATGDYLRSATLNKEGIAYVCFEQAKALCDRDKKLDDSEFRADANDPGTTVRNAILAGRAADALFAHWTARLHMQHILDRGLRFLSTGEMRKTLLVKAIMSSPGLLILDSPLDGLDRSSQTAMHEIIDQLLASNLALLLLCRQIEDIPPGISHVLVLANGRVVDKGPREAVLTNPQVDRLMNPPLPPLVPPPEPAARHYKLSAGAPLLELRDVTVVYGTTTVLQGVNWRFDPGMHCCVSGPNGCGKTTLLSLVTGDNHKAYGQNITLFGQRRGTGESVWEIKEKYGQIDTQLQLNFARGMKTIEVVVSGFFDTIGLYDDWGDAQRARALDWLQALGLQASASQSFDALSFGMQRMVLLARAMVKSPVILILDEPTLGLDAYHRRLILRAIDHIASHCDTQIIFVSHSAAEQPRCINQHLTFVPHDAGFTVTVTQD